MTTTTTNTNDNNTNAFASNDIVDTQGVISWVLQESVMNGGYVKQLLECPLSQECIDALMLVYEKKLPRPKLPVAKAMFNETLRLKEWSTTSEKAKTLWKTIIKSEGIKGGRLTHNPSDWARRSAEILIKAFKEEGKRSAVRASKLALAKAARQAAQNAQRPDREAYYRQQASVKEAESQLNKLYTQLNKCIEEEVEMFLLKIRYQQKLVNELTSLIK
jgi:hypothetical protein